MQWARTSYEPDRLVIRKQYVGADTPETVYIEGYQLQEPLPQHLIDLHRIEVGEDGFVSIFQDARMVIPQILDADAMDRQVDAVRVIRVDPDPAPPREALPNRPLIGMRVHAGGRTRSVTGMRLHAGARVKNILMPT